MHTLLNILWFCSGRFKETAGWGIKGVYACRKLTGIPSGFQHFKFAGLTLHPFGRKIVFKLSFMSFLLNAYWLMANGFGLAASAVIKGTLLCITGIGIPFGVQWFKFARLALLPFGSKIIRLDEMGTENSQETAGAGEVLEEIEIPTAV